MKPAALTLLWANCVERLKNRINNRSFWEALETCRPITVESDFLIIGLEPENFNRATHLQQVTNQHAIQETVQELFNRPLQVRLIEGTTLQDWEATKEADVRIAAMKQTTVSRQMKQDSELTGWDGLYEHIARLYMQTPLRALPQGKARYANDALYTLAEAMDTLYPEQPEDVVERSLARILERIANAADIPATVLAFELERLRAWRKASQEEADTPSSA
jgi:hypothetical protein